MPIRQRLLCLLTSVVLAAPATIHAKDTTIALTATVYKGAANQQIDLMNGLLDLLQVELSTQPELAIVERRQINLALHELALSVDLKVNAESQLQLGKIASADLILTLELKATEDDQANAAPQVLVRIVESQTGVIRGVSVASIDRGRIDQAVTQIAGYFKIVRSNPAQRLVTVAVAPFDAKDASSVCDLLRWCCEIYLRRD